MRNIVILGQTVKLVFSIPAVVFCSLVVIGLISNHVIEIWPLISFLDVLSFMVQVCSVTFIFDIIKSSLVFKYRSSAEENTTENDVDKISDWVISIGVNSLFIFLLYLILTSQIRSELSLKARICEVEKKVLTDLGHNNKNACDLIFKSNLYKNSIALNSKEDTSLSIPLKKKEER